MLTSAVSTHWRQGSPHRGLFIPKEVGERCHRRIDGEGEMKKQCIGMGWLIASWRGEVGVRISASPFWFSVYIAKPHIDFEDTQHP